MAEEAAEYARPEPERILHLDVIATAFNVEKMLKDSKFLVELACGRGFSQAFVKLMTKASELRVQYLFLHKNGEEMPDLERFDWEEDESETEAESQDGDEDDEEEEEEEEEEPTKFLLHYRCYRCGHQWEDSWTSVVDDDCGECGARHCSPYKWEDL
jgi:predicted  nucleic acid-binding Zn-ribbon protein